MRSKEFLMNLLVGAVFTAIAFCAGYYGGTVGAAVLSTFLGCIVLWVQLEADPHDDLGMMSAGFITAFAVPLVALTWVANALG